MYILEFLKGQTPEQSDKEIIACEYRLLCSGEIYNGDVNTLDWRKSTQCRLILTSPFTVFVASDPRGYNFPQELALRFKTKMVTEERVGTYKSVYMFYPDEEIAKDIAALLCVFCRRLITVCAKVREIHPNQPEVTKDWPVDIVNTIQMKSWNRHPATVIYGPKGIEIKDYNAQPKAVSEKKLKNLLLGLPNLPCAESIVYSSRLYALALEKIYQDADAAYQLLISSVETIANDVHRSYVPDEKDMIEIKNSVAKLAVSLGLSKENADKVAIESCKGISWHARKFSKFIVENTGDELWEEDELFKLPSFVLPSKDNYKSVIDEIYKARGKISHFGGSYPASAGIVPAPMIPAKMLFDTDISKRLFPSVAWFERVVNMAITNYLVSAVRAQDGTGG